MGRFGWPIVPWPLVCGKPVHTCYVDEEALGLLPAMSGWCQQGFYVKQGRKVAELQALVDAVDWARVARTKSTYDMRCAGWCVRPSVTERRWQRLMRHCLREVPTERFERELEFAMRHANPPGLHDAACLRGCPARRLHEKLIRRGSR